MTQVIAEMDLQSVRRTNDGEVGTSSPDSGINDDLGGKLEMKTTNVVHCISEARNNRVTLSWRFRHPSVHQIQMENCDDDDGGDSNEKR